MPDTGSLAVSIHQGRCRLLFLSLSIISLIQCRIRRVQAGGRADSVEREIQFPDKLLDVPVYIYKKQSMKEKSDHTYSVNLCRSAVIDLDAISMTAKAAYPGSAICRMLNISPSKASSFLVKTNGSGILR